MATLEAGKVRYEVFGPFPFHPGWELSHRNALKKFWDDLKSDGHPEDLGKAVGVYVWTIKQEGKWIPWNVGLTSKQGFSVRFIQKENTFLRLISKEPGAEFEVYLLALRSKTGRFRKPTESQVIKANNRLETMLIGSAISVNPNLRNKSKAGYLKNAVVDGYLNDREEERGDAAKSFNALFKAPSRKRN